MTSIRFIHRRFTGTMLEVKPWIKYVNDIRWKFSCLLYVHYVGSLFFRYSQTSVRKEESWLVGQSGK